MERLLLYYAIRVGSENNVTSGIDFVIDSLMSPHEAFISSADASVSC